FAQANEKFFIAAIKIDGNKRTKEYIILREMPFAIGDSLFKKELTKTIEQTKNQISNTNLFSEIKITLDSTLYKNLQVNINVKERLYFYPLPKIQLVDRFNTWLKDYNASFNRTIYGLDLTQYNFSGRRDNFNLTALTGYARVLSIGYNSLYSNAKLTEGFSIGASLSENKEIGYNTSTNNRILFYKKDYFTRKNYSIGASYNKRNNYFKRTTIFLNLRYSIVDDSITNFKNKNYFNNNNSHQLIPEIGYSVSYSNTDKIKYPLKGMEYNYSFSKRGVGIKGGINNTTLYGSFSKYFTLKNTFYTSVVTAAILKLPLEQAYINRRAIGVGNLDLRGLELYQIDGVAAATTNLTLSKKIIAFVIPIPFKIKYVPNIPVRIMAKTFSDFGYSYIPNQTTLLNNKFLYTAGFGIDVITLYDIVFKVEYSFNQLGQKGVFLHGNSGF
ncbi:MAG: POTRA domain-containing protein, partial [Ferruginibacter sp.]